MCYCNAKKKTPWCGSKVCQGERIKVQKLKPKYKNFSGKQYKQIDQVEEDIQHGDIFICQTVGYFDPFNNWDYAVVRMQEDRAEILGQFKIMHFAKKFADSI